MALDDQPTPPTAPPGTATAPAVAEPMVAELAPPEFPPDVVDTPAPRRPLHRRRATDRRPALRSPFVVAHRGASGVLPEHTLPAFARAIALGADAVEVDVVATADGRLVARHEAELADTTDAASRDDLLAIARARGASVEHAGALCTHDLPLREVTRLKARQRHSGRPLTHDDLFMVPTFAQVVGLVRRSRTRAGRVPALHVELKSTDEHARLGLPLEREVIRDLASHGWNRPDAPVLVQSFEADSLLLVAGRSSVPLLQLARLDDDGLARTTDRGLEAIATYAVGIGVSRQLLAECGDELVERAHRRGLVVHVYTFADDDPLQPDPQAAYRSALELGIDGLVTDFPDSAVKARTVWEGERARLH